DRDAARLRVKPGILDRDGGLRGEREQRFLILRGELGGTLFLGEVEVPDALSAPADRDAKKAGHRWVVRGEPDGRRVFMEVAEPDRPTGAWQEAEQSLPDREMPDPRALRLADP